MKQELITPDQLRAEEQMMEQAATNARRRRTEEAAEFSHRLTIRSRLALNVFICVGGMFSIAIGGGVVFLFWRFIFRS